MERLVGWWAGAVRRGGVDFAGLVRAVGGDKGSLARMDAADLVAAGIAAELVEAWCRFHPVVSRGRIVRICDPEYPARLAATDDPPPALFVEGDVGLLAEDGVAVVGTRGCSSLGELAARRMARGIAGAGIAVVSGLARGIDAAAHRGAMESGRTIAVLGHGLAHTSPASNRALREEILRGGGTVMTSFVDAYAPERWTFPVRNRWIAGLALAGVVIEAPVDSGALLTAEAIKQLNRPLLVVPGPGGAPSWQGGHAWVKEGHARLVDLPAEVVGLVRPGTVLRVEDTWLAELFAGRPLDDVARIRGGSTLDLLRELQLRELRGEVVRLPGQRYAPGGDPT